MKHFLFVLIAVVLLVSSAFSQPPDVLWTRDSSPAYYFGSGLNAVCALPDGGFLGAGICCISMFHGDFFTSAYVEQFDVDGNEVWVSRFWGYYAFRFPGAAAFDVKLIPSGGIIVAAGSGWGVPYLGATLLCLDDTGGGLWAITGTDYQWYLCAMRTVCVIAGGGFAAVDMDSGKVYRVDSSGNMLRQTMLYPADLYAIAATPDSGFVVAGRNNFTTSSDFYLAKFNIGGDTVWTRSYPVSMGGVARTLCTTVTGGFLMAGGALVPDAPLDSEAAVVAVDSGGNVLSVYIHHGIPPIVSMDRCAEGGYILLADRLVRINESGDTLWTRTLPCDTCGYSSVIQTADSGYIVAGTTDSVFGFGSSSYLVKYHREGLPVSEKPSAIPSGFCLSSFPNPFNPSTTISFSLPREAHARITVFDILGREVSVLADNKFASGEHRVTFDGSALPSGIYFARLQSGSNITTQKLLLLR